ncbi:MAG: type IV secretion system protein, partial [Candidatus Niyogibacteria bacterium]|nr:type IV secretion system protein [Candidatus Niyogibacteria bacterium]
LLVIAIATILRMEQYGAKRLLAKLIIAALFINFSFLATQYVIYSSNLFVMLFIPGVGDGSVTPSFSAKFIAGVNPNVLFSSYADSLIPLENINAALNATQSKINEVRGCIDVGCPPEDRLTEEQKVTLSALKTAETALLKAQSESSLGVDSLFYPVIISMVGVIAFLCVAAFALFTVAIMLLVRIVLLWFLLITSPLAFFFSILPALQPYARRWASVLVAQSVWPMAFFFFFSIIVNIISSKFVQVAMKADPLANTAFTSNYQLIMYYILLILMLLMSLKISKDIGGHATAGAAAIIKRARGYTRAAPGFAWRHGLRRGGLMVGGALGKAATGEGRVAQVLRTPGIRQTVGRFAQRGAVAVLAERRKMVTDREKEIENLNAKELKDRYKSAIDPAMKAAIINQLAKKKDLKLDEVRGFARADIDNGRGYLEKYGLKTVDVDALKPQYATKEEMADPLKVRDMFKKTSAKVLNDTLLEGGEGAESLIIGLRALGKSVDEVSNNIRLTGNIALANWMKKGPNRTLMESYIEQGEQEPEVKSAEPVPSPLVDQFGRPIQRPAPPPTPTTPRGNV